MNQLNGKDFPMTNGSINAKQKKSFFAYYRAETSADAEGLRLRSERLMRVCGGFIIDDATDVGPGLFVDMPGYARLHRALDLGTVDAFVADMKVFGPAGILGLFAICKVSGVEMWDLEGGRVTKTQLHGIRDSFLKRLNNANDRMLAISEMLTTVRSLS
jgi:hypothetical protein